jgi:hypothetical protein
MVSSFAAGLAEGAVKGMDIRSHRLAEKAKLDAAKEESKTQREWQAAENKKTRDANLKNAETRLRAQQRDAKIARAHVQANLFHTRVSRTNRPIPASEIPADTRLAMITAGYTFKEDGSYSPKSAELIFQHNTIGKTNENVLLGNASMSEMPVAVQHKHIQALATSRGISRVQARQMLERGSQTHYAAKKQKYIFEAKKVRPASVIDALELKKGNTQKFIGTFYKRINLEKPHLDLQYSGVTANEITAKNLAGDAEVIKFAMYKRLNDRIVRAKGKPEELAALEQYFNSSHRKEFKAFVQEHKKRDGRLILTSQFMKGEGGKFVVNLNADPGKHSLHELYRISEMRLPSNAASPTKTEDLAAAAGESTAEYLRQKARGKIHDPVVSDSSDAVKVNKVDNTSPGRIKKNAGITPSPPTAPKGEIAIVSKNGGEDVDVIENPEYFDTLDEIKYMGLLDFRRKADVYTYGNKQDTYIFETAERLGVYSNFNKALTQSTQLAEIPEDTYEELFDSVKKLMGNGATDGDVFTAVNGIFMQRVLYKTGNTGRGRQERGMEWTFDRRSEHDFTDSEALLYKEATTLGVKLQDFSGQQKRFNTIIAQTGHISKSLENYVKSSTSRTFDDATLQEMRIKIARDVAAIYNDPETKVRELVKKTGVKYSEKDLNAIERDLRVAGTAREGVFNDVIHKAFNVFQDILNSADFLKETINWRTFGVTLSRQGFTDPRLQARDLVGWGRNFNSKDKRKLQGTRNRLVSLAVIAQESQERGINKIREAQRALTELGEEKGSEQYVLAQANLMQSYLAARRDMLKVAMTYTFAGMLQGESGGRSISNEDFQIIYDSLWSPLGGVSRQGRVDEFNETVKMIRNRVETNLKYIGYGSKERPITQLPKAMLGLSRAKQRFTLKRKYPTGIYTRLKDAPAPIPSSGWAGLPLIEGITSIVDIQKGKTPMTFNRDLNTDSFVPMASRMQTTLFSGIFTAAHRNLTDETRMPFGELGRTQQTKVSRVVRGAAKRLLEAASQSKNLTRQLEAVRFNNSSKSLGEMLKSWVSISNMSRSNKLAWLRNPENTNFMTEFVRQMHDSVVNYNNPGAAR